MAEGMESTLANNEIAGWVGPAPALSLIAVGLDFQVKGVCTYRQSNNPRSSKVFKENDEGASQVKSKVVTVEMSTSDHITEATGTLRGTSLPEMVVRR